LLFGGVGNVGELPDDLLALVEGDRAALVFVVGVEQLEKFFKLDLGLLFEWLNTLRLLLFLVLLLLRLFYWLV
jgi:hypothetical protein